jgi:plasmid stabilization system protein ParE
MSAYAVTPLAKADIFSDRVERAIYEACEFVAASPERGHSRPDLTTRLLRFWTLTRFPNYSIVYRPETMPIEIVTVLHGKRDIRRILTQT